MILGATAVFLGLAVLGWGGFSAFFSQFGTEYGAYCARTSRAMDSELATFSGAPE